MLRPSMPFNSFAFALLFSSNRYLAGFSRVPVFWVLLAGSLVFYAFAGIIDLGVIVLAIVGNWLIAKLALPDRWHLGVAVVLNLGLLVFFKYQGLLDTDGVVGGSYADIALPLGISFYTFQMIAYHVDVVKGRTPPAESFKAFVLFVGFYPQLVAGPIVRANQLLPQINRAISGRLQQKKIVLFGMLLVTLGLTKKIVFADSLGPIVDDIFFLGPDSFGQAWLGAVLFAFQIYFDFSGYSDIAVGAAYLLGFRIPFNFRTPYLSAGPAEFWQRWHITLSNWIRDYLYFPLGGSRGSATRIAIVLVLTMALAGLWHGADFTFIVWGAVWGLYILVGRLLRRIPFRNRVLSWTLNMGIVTILWVFFRAPGIGEAFEYIAVMFNFGLGFGDKWVAIGIVAGVAGLFAFHWLESVVSTALNPIRLRRFNTRLITGVLVGLIVGLLLIPVDAQNPFIYFRF